MTTANNNKYTNGTYLRPDQLTFVIQQLDLNICALREAIDRIGADVQMLLDDRTAPLEFDSVQIQAKKLPTAETVQISLENEGSESKVIQPERYRKHAIERFELNVARNLGGPKIFKTKLNAKLARIRIEGSTATSGKGCAIGKLRIHDKMKVSKNGQFHPGTCSVDFFTIEEREQLKQHLRENYGYVIGGRHA